MSGIGRLNLLGIFAMPVFAALASIIVFGEENYAQVQVFVFGTNLIPMLIGGVVSAFLIRSANKKSKNKWVAISPTLLPAGLGILWYLIGIINTSAYDAGREFLLGLSICCYLPHRSVLSQLLPIWSCPLLIVKSELL